MRPNIVKHPQLAAEGRRRIEWAQKNMPVLNRIEKVFRQEQPFDGMRVLVCVHLEAKTAYLAEVFATGGATVAVTGSNPDSTKDDVVAALDEAGVHVYAANGASWDDMHTYMSYALDLAPQIVIDDGGDIVELLHGPRRDVLSQVKGVCEETTTGVMRARARASAGELDFPVVLINEAYCKYLFDNYHGTGQSVWDAVMRTTNLTLCGKTIVIVGYGWCGKGCADRARGLGANIIVCETDPIKAIEAVMQGFRVMPLLDACALGDFVLTVTGNRNVLSQQHFLEMKDGVVVANAGHFSVEIDLHALTSLSKNQVQARHQVSGFQLESGKWIYLLGEGNIVNIACGDGHPAEIMDTSFSLQALSAQYIVTHDLDNTVHNVPADIDQTVARMKLESMGLQIDNLTDEQNKFIQGWEVT